MLLGMFSRIVACAMAVVSARAGKASPRVVSSVSGKRINPATQRPSPWPATTVRRGNEYHTLSTWKWLKVQKRVKLGAGAAKMIQIDPGVRCGPFPQLLINRGDHQSR